MLKWGHRVGKDGGVEVTRFDYNKQAGAETPDQPEVPFCARHVWDWWWELNARREPGFESLSPLTYSEVAFWLLLTGTAAAPEEIKWLMTMDDKWLFTVSEEKKAKQEREKERAEREAASKTTRRK